SKYIEREISAVIDDVKRFFSVITITGPRQSGKSTLLRHIFPELPYYSLEDPDTRLFLKEDPKGFLTSFEKGVILDEIQNIPELLSYIQTIVDIHPEKKFYLTGSSNFSLMRNITQSLAGRTALFELMPLSLKEIQEVRKNNTVDELLYSGFYPSIWSGKNIPKYFYPNYIKTYIERDVRDLLGIKDLDIFQRFVRLIAARIGSIFNATEIANEIGVTVNTIKAWISVLQASYIVYLLPPFFTNTRKRLTKSPKIYFTDTGVAAYLLEIFSPQIMNRDKMRGHLFENMLIMEIMKCAYNKGESPSLYFYRDSNGNEVDLLIRNGERYDCIEIKSSQTYHPDFTKGLKTFAKAFPHLIGKQSVAYAGESVGKAEDIHILNYQDAISRFC
ncbi:MAG: ATP-binding protein, partial [Muribaculaceae bacterium]|nr:ATP-binding protein [Muribaculaceae bacterium]